MTLAELQQLKNLLTKFDRKVTNGLIVSFDPNMDEFVIWNPAPMSDTVRVSMSDLENRVHEDDLVWFIREQLNKKM